MAAVFHIATAGGARLGIAADGRLAAGPASDALRPVVLHRAAGNPALGFLYAGLEAAIRIDGGAIGAAVQPWRVRDTDPGIALHDPDSPAQDRVLTAGADGTLALAGDADAPEARFSLVALPAGSADPAGDAVADLIETLVPADLNGPDLLDGLLHALTPATAAVFQAVLRLLPADQLAWLGVTLLGLPEHLARFAAAYPADIWAQQAMPALSLWLATRATVAHVVLPPRWDFLAGHGMDGRPTSIGHRLNAAARAAVPPRRCACVIATARNEGPYLLEWVAYHRAIGAGGIFIYSNDNADGSDDLLRALAQAGAITWLENHLATGGAAQPKAYGHAFGVLPQVLDFRWSLVVDLDEFFAFDTRRFHALPDYIAWQETRKVDAVALNWLVFGSDGEAGWSDRPLTERFTRRLPWIDMHIKSLSRTNLCLHSHPHHAAFTAPSAIVTRDSDGGLHRSAHGASFSAEPRADRAWVAHYFLKSAEEFIWKFSRNRGDHRLVRDTDPALIDAGFAEMFVKQHTSPTMVADPRILPCAPGLRSEMDRLRGLPGVAQAEARVLEAYRAGVGALLERMRGSAAFPPGSPVGEVLGLCSVEE